jgi:hypothetical protein
VATCFLSTRKSLQSRLPPRMGDEPIHNQHIPPSSASHENQRERLTRRIHATHSHTHHVSAQLLLNWVMCKQNFHALQTPIVSANLILELRTPYIAPQPSPIQSSRSSNGTNPSLHSSKIPLRGPNIDHQMSEETAGTRTMLCPSSTHIGNRD